MNNMIRTIVFFSLFLAAGISFGQQFQTPPDSLSACNGRPPAFMEAGNDKIHKLQYKVLPQLGVKDTANITVRVSTVRIHHYTDGDPVPEGAEIIPMGKYSVACYRGIPIYEVNNLLSKCIDLNRILEYYGYDKNIYYIEFFKDGKHLDTSFFKYATPLGRKQEMKLVYED